jgi:hypothetical protein
MEENQKQPKMGSVLKTELVISSVILALGIESLLSDLNLLALDLSPFLIRCGLLILVVWVAQLLTSWERLYSQEGTNQFPLGGLPHLWMFVLYIGLVYLACNNHGNYLLVILCITLIVALDFIDSAIEWKLSPSEYVREVNYRWLKRDFFPFTPSLIIGWALYWALERYSPNAPTLWSGIFSLLEWLPTT